MKGFSDHVKSLIDRYLRNEASEQDFIEITALLEENPALLQDIQRAMESPDHQLSFLMFDAAAAFNKLNRRLTDEGLI